MNKVLTLLFVFCLSTALWGQETSILRSSNLRSGPSISGRILATLPAATPVTIISRYPRSGYVRVQTAKDGKTGWVVQRNVKQPESPPRSAPEEPVPEPGSPPVGDTSIYPHPKLTPGKADVTVTQKNLAENICNKNWTTGQIRPDTRVTDHIKVETMKAYGIGDAANNYELDHLVSLQNGGCPDCVENLWPQAYGDKTHPMTQNDRAAWNKAHPGSTVVLPGALEKDLVENHIHDEICFGISNAKMSVYVKKYPPAKSITLSRAQEILSTDWYACYRNMMDGNRPCE
jgi:hypothetical protein